MPFLLCPQRKDYFGDSAREPSQLTFFDQNARIFNLQLLHTAYDARPHAGADTACTTYMIPTEEVVGKLWQASPLVHLQHRAAGLLCCRPMHSAVVPVGMSCCSIDNQKASATSA